MNAVKFTAVGHFHSQNSFFLFNLPAYRSKCQELSESVVNSNQYDYANKLTRNKKNAFTTTEKKSKYECVAHAAQLAVQLNNLIWCDCIAIQIAETWQMKCCCYCFFWYDGSLQFNWNSPCRRWLHQLWLIHGFCGRLWRFPVLVESSQRAFLSMSCRQKCYEQTT